jgi:tetratricopeptide (TPR) repeat protein
MDAPVVDPLAFLQQRLATGENPKNPYVEPADEDETANSGHDLVSSGFADILSRAEPLEETPIKSSFLPAQLLEVEPLTENDDDLLEFENMFNDDPSNTSLLDYLATEYFERAYFHRAAFVYRMIADFDPARCDALYFLAESLVKTGQQEDAIPCLASILSQKSDDPDILVKADVLLGELRHFSEPVVPSQPVDIIPEIPPYVPKTVIESVVPAEVQAPASGSSGLSAALNRANIFSIPDSSDTTDVNLIKERLDKDPDNPALLDWYAFRLYTEGMITESVSIYQRLVNETEAPAEEALYYLGNGYLKMFKYREARRYWEILVDRYPDSEISKKAAQKLQKIQELSERDKVKRKKVAAPAGHLGRMKPKRVLTKKAAPDMPLSAIGSIVDTSAKISSSLLKPIESDPGDPGEDMVFTQYSMGDGSGAAEVEAMLSSDPDNPDLLDWAAFTNYTNNNFEKALELYHRALSINDDIPQTYYYLGTIYGRLENYREALKYWSILVERYPQDKVTNKVLPKLESLRTKAGNIQYGAAAPVAESPAVAAPVVQTPAAAAPVVQTPAAAAPVAQTPAAAAPVAESPAVAAPVAESPAVAAPVVQTPAAAAPVAQTPVAAPSVPPVPELTPEQVGKLELLMENSTRDLLENERKEMVAATGIDKEEMLFHIEAALAKVKESLELEDWAAYLNYACGNYDEALGHYLFIMKKDANSPQVYFYVGTILCKQERFKDALKYWKVLCKKYPTSRIAIATKPEIEKLKCFVK